METQKQSLDSFVFSIDELSHRGKPGKIYTELEKYIDEQLKPDLKEMERLRNSGDSYSLIRDTARLYVDLQAVNLLQQIVRHRAQPTELAQRVTLDRLYAGLFGVARIQLIDGIADFKQGDRGEKATERLRRLGVSINSFYSSLSDLDNQESLNLCPPYSLHDGALHPRLEMFADWIQFYTALGPDGPMWVRGRVNTGRKVRRAEKREVGSLVGLTPQTIAQAREGNYDGYLRYKQAVGTYSSGGVFAMRAGMMDGDLREVAGGIQDVIEASRVEPNSNRLLGVAKLGIRAVWANTHVVAVHPVDAARVVLASARAFKSSKANRKLES